MLLNGARRVWATCKGLWSAILVTFLISYAANIAQTPSSNFGQSFSTSLVGWLFLGPDRVLTFSIVFLLCTITIVAGGLQALEDYYGGGRVLKRYLREVADKNQDLRPAGFAQQSALVSVSVPLDDIFIHLRAISDRPRHDIPSEQLRLREELRGRDDLSPEQREEQLQAMRFIWYSQMGQEQGEGQIPQPAPVETVLLQLSAEQPGIVILGAPGSGKTTTLRWFAFHMASAWKLPRYRRWLFTFFQYIRRITPLPPPYIYQLPRELAPAQIPIMLRISDYAKMLSKQDSGHLSFQEFFVEHFKHNYPNLPNLIEKLLHQLQHGHCLVLLDGLDEVADDELRRRVSKNVMTFLVNHSPDKATAKEYNRFIITSRIIGYEAGNFSSYAHYTLQELEYEQIKRFLEAWCPAVERHQKAFTQGMKKLTLQQQLQADKEGAKQRDRLLETLQDSPGIKRLALNPLMLTILALIQRSGNLLPHRRVDLYHIVVHTLLDNWNLETSRKVFHAEEIPLAEDILMLLAHALHSSDLLLTELQVKQIAREAMTNFYKQQPTDTTIKQFIDTLRSSSGLFVESGQGLFSFMHRTFQEYFVARYLRLQPHEELKQFVQSHYHLAIWHEPLLLLIAYKSGQSSEERQQASELIQAIVQTSTLYDTILHRNLLFAAKCLADCNIWSINHQLQQKVIYQLFDLYGDSLGSGRYTQLQQEMEKIVLLWLRGQPQGSTQERTLPPLLKAWQFALCDASSATRQKGAVHLLAALAPDLFNCSQLVLNTLIPPLIKITDLEDLPCPAEIREQLLHITAQPASQEIEEYAFAALRLLDNAGPAGWLRDEWMKWKEQKPHYLARLTQHSLELDYLLTPAAFPIKNDNPNWLKQFAVGQEWQKRGTHNLKVLQDRLLEVSETARYPCAYVFKQLIDSEDKALADSSQNQDWQIVWDTFLSREMQRGRSATYQICLNLRLLLYKGDEQKLQGIANELKEAASLPGQQQKQALCTISNIYLRYLHYTYDLQYIRYLQDLQYLRDLLDLRYIRYIRDLLDLHDLINLLDLLDLRQIFDLQYHLLVDFLYILDLRHLRDIENLLDLRYIRDLLSFRFIIKFIDQAALIDNLCRELIAGDAASLMLLVLYSIISSYETIPLSTEKQIKESIAQFEKQRIPTKEAQFLMAALLRLTERSKPVVSSGSASTQAMPDEQAELLYDCTKSRQLTLVQVSRILATCIDTRELSEEEWKKVTGRQFVFRVGAVGEFAWKILDNNFSIETEAFPLLIDTLNDENAIICATAARLLQHPIALSVQQRESASSTIIGILMDNSLSFRPLQPSGYTKIWRLDDILFETLKMLAE